MFIGERIRELRLEKDMSHGDIEKRTGLLRCYISRVENGHTIPALETLEKFARALDTPIYLLLYDGDSVPHPKVVAGAHSSPNGTWGTHRQEVRLVNQLRLLLGRMSAQDRDTILCVAAKMASRKNKRPSEAKEKRKPARPVEATLPSADQVSSPA